MTTEETHAPTPLLVGTGRVSIDPPLGISHGNWGAQSHLHAEGRHRQLLANVLVLRQGATTVAICDLDLCLLRDEGIPVREAVARVLGVDIAAVRVSTSHTHAGPELSRSLHSGDPSIERAYLASLPHLVAGAALEALGRLEPANLRAGEGSLRYAVNRRQVQPDGQVLVGCDFDGVTDPAVPVVRFDATDGRPLAVVFGYAMHPTILAHENKLLSPDYPGVARDVVQKLTGAPAFFLQGCAGDQGPGPEGFTADLAAVERAGRALGSAAASAALELRVAGFEPVFDEVVMSGATLGCFAMRPTVEPDLSVAVRSREVALPVKDTGSLEACEAEVNELERQRDAVRAEGGPEEALVDLTWRAKRAHIRMRQAKDCGGLSHKPVEVQAIRVGPAVFVGVPLELFADVGLRVKERSPFAVTHVSGYTNGAFGYLPNRRAFTEGGYEVDATYFLPGADALLVDAMVDLIEELHAAPRSDGGGERADAGGEPAEGGARTGARA